MDTMTQRRQKSNLLKIGEVTRKLGVSASMIRSLESVGLVNPTRSQGRYRMYAAEDLRVLQHAIRLLRTQGLNASAVLVQLNQEGLLDMRAGVAKKEPAIGPRLRELRIVRAKSLSTVSDAVGVSKGFLSNLERSRNRASTAILEKLALYYGLSCIDVNKVNIEGPLVRARERKKLCGSNGIQIHMLAPRKVSMEPYIFRIAPGARSGEFCSQDGEQFLYLLRGRLNIRLSRDKFQLRAGDSFYFYSNARHRWSNPGKTDAIFICVNTRSAAGLPSRLRDTHGGLR
jgi:DNA-binding transcriptional MerR regulator/quercetin dioxygenase-like cupin family protein